MVPHVGIAFVIIHICAQLSGRSPPGSTGFSEFSQGWATGWRIKAPTGETFQPRELLELRHMIMQTDALQSRVRELESIANGAALAIDAEAVAILRAAVDVLDESHPRAIGRPRVRILSVAA